MEFTIIKIATTEGPAMYLSKEEAIEMMRNSIGLVPLFDSITSPAEMEDGEKTWWKKWTGNYKYVITFNGRNRDSVETKTFYGKLLPNIINKYKDIHTLRQRWYEILNIYRNSGLIPKVVIKKHRKRIVDKYGFDYIDNKAALAELEFIAASYICKYSKCPSCNKRMMEHIAGYACTNHGTDQHVFDTSKGEWW